MTTVQVPIQLLRGGALPLYATPDAAGADLYAAESIELWPGQTVLLRTGIKLALPENCEAQVRPRSGLSLRTDLRLPNAPGTIDADYRDEVCVILQNTFSAAALPELMFNRPELVVELQERYQLVSWRELIKARGLTSAISWPQAFNGYVVYVDELMRPFGTIHLEAGDRVAQLVLSQYVKADWLITEDVSAIGNNRSGGFGSTGLNDVR